MSEPTRDPPVLIVGGGPTGLSMAIVLARLGIRNLLVERRAATTDHPKARAVNLRSMELFRQWGVEEGVVAGALPQEWWRFIWCRTLAGEEIGRVETAPDQLTDKSPTVRRIVSQDVVERALLERARALPLATLAFSTEMMSFSETGTGVVAELVDRVSGTTSTCRAEYMVAADGATSSVRERLHIAMRGPRALAYQMSVYFRADLTRWTAHRPADIYYCTDGDWIGVVNGTTTWLLIARLDTEAEGRRLTTADLEQRIRRSVGVADLPVEVINATFWQMGAQAAERFRRGRVLLAGDSAHVMSPTGGFGMNTGIQDAHNLGWKLAAVLRGDAGGALLDTYEQERRPVAESNAAWSAENAERIWGGIRSVASGDRDAVAAALRDQVNHISSEGRALGFRYTSAAVVPDGAPVPESSTRVYHPTASPGCRAPHARLIDDGAPISTLDLFDCNLVLLAGVPGEAWHEAVTALPASRRSLLEFGTVGPGGRYQDPDGRWLELYGIDHGGAVLVRPDGHVAWRSRVLPADPASVLDSVVRRVLALFPRW